MILQITGYLLGVCVLLHSLLAHVAATPSLRSRRNAMIELSSTWQVLGPFQIGTREAVWGTDPTEAYGGFRILSYDANSRFPSSLAREGYVVWSEVGAKDRQTEDDSSRVTITVTFPDIDWPFLRSIYGWSALQYQAWARGNLSISESASESVVLYTDNILELWIDGHHYFGGDFYAFRRAPLVLQLDKGIHQIDLRFIRDVRAMGGGDEPSTMVILEAKTTTGGLTIDAEKLLISDVVSGRLANNLASVTVRNEGTGWIDIMDIVSVDGFALVSLFRDEPFQLGPGASRSLIFKINLTASNESSLSFRLVIVNSGIIDLQLTPSFSSKLRHQSLFDAQKFTFLHPSGILSYAILRPPLEISKHGPQPQSYPVLLNLHGAGLEADSEQVRHMLDASPELRTWLLFPSGVTSWSGDDWHNWGFEDIQGAINALPQWIVQMEWNGPNASTSDWLVSGHSNGGQGTWHILSHYPDKLIAAAPVSAYTSIQAYVPYNMWHEAPPLATSVVQTALSSYRHELFVENFLGIPLLFQHGSADSNVPVFHSRRVYQLLSEIEGRQSSNWRQREIFNPAKYAGKHSPKGRPRNIDPLAAKSFVHRRHELEVWKNGQIAGARASPEVIQDSVRSAKKMTGTHISQGQISIEEDQIGVVDACLLNCRSEDYTFAESIDSADQRALTEAKRHTEVYVENAEMPDWEARRFRWPMNYVELTGKGHWFEGVMTTPQLKFFYEKHLSEHPSTPGLPPRFKIRVPGCGIMGSRGGIEVDQVLSPDQYGEIEVVRDDVNSTWRISTSNVKRFHLSVPDVRAPIPGRLMIDGEPHLFPVESGLDGKNLSFLRSRGGWMEIEGDDWHDVSERYGRQRGGLAAMLLTKDRFTILSTGNNTYGIATQISRNLFQYYGADSVVLMEQAQGPPLLPEGTGNVITVVSGAHVAPSELQDYPIRVEANRLTLNQGQAEGQRHVNTHFRFETGLGALFLRPLQNERLELVVWGADDLGLQQAARLVPTLTGAGQPDFVVMSRSCMWKGVGGVYAMGFLDHSWKVSQASFIR